MDRGLAEGTFKINGTQRFINGEKKTGKFTGAVRDRRITSRGRRRLQFYIMNPNIWKRTSRSANFLKMTYLFTFGAFLSQGRTRRRISNMVFGTTTKTEAFKSFFVDFDGGNRGNKLGIF